MRMTLCAVLATALLLPVHALADELGQEHREAQEVPTAQEQIAQFEAMCAASADDHEKRQAEGSLFERLGGEKGVRALTTEIMRLHGESDQIGHFFSTSDPAAGVEAATRYFIWKSGGPEVYDGPSLTDSHGHMKISDADFVAAGGDVFQAMQTLEYEQNEIDEFVCLLVGLRTEVVHTSDPTSAQ